MLTSIFLTKSKVRSQLLGILFSNPTRWQYLSGLAKAIQSSAGNVQRELKRLEKDELIEREKKEGRVYYRVNVNHALYPEFRSLILKTLGITGELQSLAGKFKSIQFALLFGSFARGDEKGESDIDLLVVSDKNLEIFYTQLASMEKKFRRDINPVAYSSREFREKILSGNSFVKNILKNKFKILKGKLNEYAA
jgi:predicted nucleotidyltransferase/predicted transcriptional regulator with HTH domain